MASKEWASRMAMAHNEQAYLTPDDPDDNALYHCDICGKPMFEGDIVYEDFSGNQVCEDCITEAVRDHSRELEKPEPDWDDMPGGADFCDW